MISEEVKTVDKDGVEWHSGQEILVAIGLSGNGVVLGYSGSLVFPFITDMGASGSPFWMTCLDIFPAECYPRNPGVYLWKGSIGVIDEDGEYDFECAGDFTPAYPEEIERLTGKYDPLPEPEDRS